MASKKLIWKRALKEPFIKPCAETVAPDAVTTPDIVKRDGVLDLYIGAVDGNKERIIHMCLSPNDMKTDRSIAVSSSATVILNAGPADFDCHHVFDPAAIRWQGKTYLYYSGIGKIEDSIGLAISDDGIKFKKKENLLLIGRSPEVIIKDEMIYLFYVLKNERQNYAIFAARSNDCISFESVSKEPVLTPGDPGQWDDMEVTTPRIIKIEGMYYMIFAGLNQNDKKDIPRAFGLARSKDLISWRKYPQNPVFRIAKQGSWDDGALWFGTPVRDDNNVYLIYEGGQVKHVLGKTPALTQVGLAKVSMKSFKDFMMDWK